MSLRKVVAAAAARIDAAFLGGGPAACTLHHLVGQTLRGLGQLDSAAEQLERALACSADVDPDTDVRIRLDLAGVLTDLGRHEHAERITAELAPRLEAELGRIHDSTLAAWDLHATVLVRAGRPREAIPILRSVLETSEAAFGPSALATIAHKNNLVSPLLATSAHDEALALAEEARDQVVALLGEDHPNAQVVVMNHAVTLLRTGHPAQAEPILTELARDRGILLGPAHPHTLLTRRWLGIAQAEQQRLEAAEATLGSALDDARTAGSSAAMDVDLALELAEVRVRGGKSALAESTVRDLLAGEAAASLSAAQRERAKAVLRSLADEASGR